MMSYWAKTPERLAQFLFIEGHIDTSDLLLVKAPYLEEPNLSERCLRPHVICMADGQLCAYMMLQGFHVPAAFLVSTLGRDRHCRDSCRRDHRAF